MSNALTSVMYHYIRPIAAGRYALRGLEVEQFTGQLEYLQRYYNPVTLEQVLGSIETGAPLPERPVLVFFDDGYRDHFRHVFPALERRGMKGIFFPIARAALDRRLILVNKVQFVLASTREVKGLVAEMENAIAELGGGHELASFADYRQRHFHATRLDTAEVIYIKRMLQVALPPDLAEIVADALFRRHVTTDEKSFADDLYMSLDDLKTLKATGHHIGCHGENHFWMSSLDKERQRVEVVSALRLHDRLGLPRRKFTFCYPYGDYNDESLAILGELDCSIAFTAEVAIAEPTSANRYRLPRLDTIDLPMNAAAPPNEWTRRAAGSVTV